LEVSARVEVPGVPGVNPAMRQYSFMLSVDHRDISTLLSSIACASFTCGRPITQRLSSCADLVKCVCAEK